MKRLFFLLPVLFLTSPAVAQNVDFEIPAEINIIEGRLAVAFNDGISEEEARSMIESLGYDVLQINFKPLSAVASTPEALEIAVLTQLKEARGVVNVAQTDRPENALRLVPETHAGAINNHRYKTWIEFQSHLSVPEAQRLLRAITSIPFEFTPRPANEIIIEVGDNDEEAFTQIDGHEMVKWVTYVGIAGD